MVNLAGKVKLLSLISDELIKAYHHYVFQNSPICFNYWLDDAAVSYQWID